MSREARNPKLAQARCPTCGKLTDAATSIPPGRQPQPGDLSVCLYCAALLTFESAEDGTLVCRAFTDAEVESLDPETKLAFMAAYTAVVQVQRRRGNL